MTIDSSVNMTWSGVTTCSKSQWWCLWVHPDIFDPVL